MVALFHVGVSIGLASEPACIIDVINYTCAFPAVKGQNTHFGKRSIIQIREAQIENRNIFLAKGKNNAQCRISPLQTSTDFQTSVCLPMWTGFSSMILLCEHVVTNCDICDTRAAWASLMWKLCSLVSHGYLFQHGRSGVALPITRDGSSPGKGEEIVH